MTSITNAASNEMREMKEEMAYIGTINIIRTTILWELLSGSTKERF
jgi:hypothetical protein